MSEAIARMKNSDEMVYSGYLVKGEERKNGTQVAFKDKKKYFVLRCARNKLLTLTAYKDEKDFRNFGRRGKVVNPDRFIETYNERVKVHKMQMDVRKHRSADILCILQDKRPLYLSAKNREDLDAWYNAFRAVLIQLGWKEETLDEQRPVSFPPTNVGMPTDQVNGDRNSTPAVMEKGFEVEPSEATCHDNKLVDGGYLDAKTYAEPSHPSSCNVAVTRSYLPPPPIKLSSASLEDSSQLQDPLPLTLPKSPNLLAKCIHAPSRRSVPIGDSPATAYDKEDCQFCCQRHHLLGLDTTYGNIHNVNDVRRWRKDVSIRREKLVDVRHFYEEYVGPPSPESDHALFNKQMLALRDRRRSRSTSDIPAELHRLHCVWNEPESSSSEEETPPDLPERGNSVKKSNDKKPILNRRTGAAIMPPQLDQLVCPPDLHDKNQMNDCLKSPLKSPSMIVQQFLTKHHPVPEGNRERKISAPTNPHIPHLYINAPNNGGPAPSQLRRGHGSMIDVRGRPLPSPADRPSSLVQTLLWEQELFDGMPITVPKHDLHETLALVKIADYVWIAGKKRGCPNSISRNFHVGDQLRQINEQILVDVTIAHALFKTTAKDEVTLLVKRLPHAKMFTIKRSSAAVGWGLHIEGNKVMDVPNCGPAHDAGIEPRPEGVFSKRLCSWVITQINNTPVSLSCSKEEVKNRLANDVSMEISIILQPEDFINKLKSELQSVRFSIDYL